MGNDRFSVTGHNFTAKAYPIGIETEAFAAMASRASGTTLAKRMTESLGGKDLIIGVDRLDYSKGITQRIDAFGRQGSGGHAANPAIVPNLEP